VDKVGAGSLGITSPYNEKYKPALLKELALLDFIRQSPLTAQIEEQDHLRDSIIRGLVALVKALVRHPIAAKREAGAELERILAHYGNVAERSYDDETAAIDDIIREFATAVNAALVATAGIGEWIEQLAAANAKFSELMEARYAEVGSRPETSMTEARAAVDEALDIILDRVEAMIVLNGIDYTAGLAPFVNEYNALVERFQHILAIEKGRRAAKRNEEDIEDVEEIEES
jgi:hypothetical protein